MRAGISGLFSASAARLGLGWIAALWFTFSANANAYNDRVALVIGNDQYPSEPLKNAVNDARHAKAFARLGFKVVFRPNADTVQMRAAAVEFTKILDGATAAVFYYAGARHSASRAQLPHSDRRQIWLGSRNCVWRHRRAANHRLHGRCQSSLQEFVILDACRNNPVPQRVHANRLAKCPACRRARWFRLAAPGAVAFDGDQMPRNGIYQESVARTENARPGGSHAGIPAGRIRRWPKPAASSSPVLSRRSPAAAVLLEKREFANQRPGGSATMPCNLARSFGTSIKDKRLDDFRAYLEQFPWRFARWRATALTT